MTDGSNKPSRREVLRGLARAAALGAVAAAAWALTFGGGSRPADGECVDRSRCRDCPALDDCALPEADAARRRGATR